MIKHNMDGKMRKNQYSIAVIAGDGIGKEVIPEGLRVLEAAGKKHGINFEFTDLSFYINLQINGNHLNGVSDIKSVLLWKNFYSRTSWEKTPERWGLSHLLRLFRRRQARSPPAEK